MSIISVNKDNFDQEVLNSDIPVLVDFWAQWCGPCRALNPTIEELASEYEGKIKIAKVNIDENPEISSNYSVMSIPTLLIFNNGEVAEQMVGLVPKEKIEKKISSQI
jgi:thioredoxin 1